MYDVKKYFWDEPLLSCLCANGLYKTCANENDIRNILHYCHSPPYGGNVSRNKTTTANILQSGFYWPTIFRDAYRFEKACEHCQRVGNVSKRQELQQNGILEVELFDV